MKNTAETDDSEYVIEIPKTGYVFQLERPLPVEVLQGRIRGSRRTPITAALPTQCVPNTPGPDYTPQNGRPGGERAADEIDLAPYDSFLEDTAERAQALVLLSLFASSSPGPAAVLT